MSTIIESIEQRQLRKDIPRFKAGDTVRVHFQVIEGQRRRVQVFEGIVIKRQGSGARETFTVRKQSFGVGVERTFPVHSPKIEKIEVGAIGDVNRAKLYYLREKIGKKARVRELRQTPAQLAAARAESEANQAALDAAAEAEAEQAAARPPRPSPRSRRPRRGTPSPRPRSRWRARGGRRRAREEPPPDDVRRRRPTRRRSAAALAALHARRRRLRAEDPQQEAAREEVQEHVRALAAYDADDVHCTDAAKVWFSPQETSEFTCAVRLAEGGCDWFDVRRRPWSAAGDRDARRARRRLHAGLRRRIRDEVVAPPAATAATVGPCPARPARSSSPSTASSARASSPVPTRPGAARWPGRSSSRASCSTTSACATTACGRSRR